MEAERQIVARPVPAATRSRHGRARAKILIHPNVEVVAAGVRGSNKMKIPRGSPGDIGQGNEGKQPGGRRINQVGRNDVVADAGIKNLYRRSITQTGAGKIAATLGLGRHRGILIKWRLPTSAVVIHEIESLLTIV